MDCSRLEPLGRRPGGGGGAGALDMSMAEAFVSMITDDLTLVTQLEMESSDLLATPTGTLSPATPSPATPIAPIHQHINTAMPTTLMMATTPIDPATPISAKTASKLATAATPTTTPTNYDLHSNGSSPTLNSCGSQSHSHHQKNGKFHNPRRELFPESDTANEKGTDSNINFDLSVLNLTDDDYLGDTILLTDEELGRCSNGSISLGCVSAQDKHIMIQAAKKAPGETAVEQQQLLCGGEEQLLSPNTPTQDTTLMEVMKLTNEELKRKLVSLGEHPGPINATTRSAYQLYLVKLQEGIQPTGNKGYKGMSLYYVLVVNGVQGF